MQRAAPHPAFGWGASFFGEQTHARFDPLRGDLPLPRVHQVRYHGAPRPRSSVRDRIVPETREFVAASPPSEPSAALAFAQAVPEAAEQVHATQRASASGPAADAYGVPRAHTATSSKSWMRPIGRPLHRKVGRVHVASRGPSCFSVYSLWRASLAGQALVNRRFTGTRSDVDAVEHACGCSRPSKTRGSRAEFSHASTCPPGRRRPLLTSLEIAPLRGRFPA